jgi:PAS domain S-box-containing protein
VSVPAAPIRVVIADDAVGLRRLLRAVLTRQPGFEVVGEAGNGAEALMAVSRTRPDLVLLDLGMPVMDGLEALPRIIELSPSTRVVVLSGFNPGRMEHEALALGAHSYLTKGLSPGELVAALHRAVEGDGPERPVAAEPAHGEESETLLQSEDRFGVLLDEVVDYAIVMLDAEGRVAGWNTGAHRITGYSATDVLGRHVNCFYPRGDAESGGAEHDLAEARDRGRIETEGPRVRADGSRFWASCVVTSMRDDGGELRGYAVVLHDVSARREAEQGLAEALAAADEALYAARTGGRDRSEVAPAARVAGGHLGAPGWGQVIEELVAGRGMTSVFQPVVDLATGRTAGYEALGRPAGDDPDADVEPLFDAAERLGYGRDLDWLCRRVALHEARSLPAGSTLFVNVGVSALLDPVHDVDQMLLLLRWAGRPASEVVLEITERELVVDHGRLAEVLASYRSHGFRFAVDDLGDGHSTLEMLAASVPEFLKISGRITRSATSVGPRSAICAMVAFAAQSGARVVAEGIENPTHLRLMQELGVELGQGFGLERPALATVWANGRS